MFKQQHAPLQAMDSPYNKKNVKIIKLILNMQDDLVSSMQRLIQKKTSRLKFFISTVDVDVLFKFLGPSLDLLYHHLQCVTFLSVTPKRVCCSVRQENKNYLRFTALLPRTATLLLQRQRCIC